MKCVVLFVSVLLVATTVHADDDTSGVCVLNENDKVEILKGMGSMSREKSYITVEGALVDIDMVFLRTYAKTNGDRCNAARITIADRNPIEVDACKHSRRGWRFQ